MNKHVIIKKGWENYLNFDFYDNYYDKQSISQNDGEYFLQVNGTYQSEEGNKQFSFEVKMALEQLKQFDNFLLLKKGLQKMTRQGHITSLNVVIKKIKSENPSHDEFNNHILWMNEQEYSHSHITNTSKAIEYFTEFKGDSLTIAKTRRPVKLVTDVLTEAEVNAMIRMAKNLREKAMVALLAFSGARNKEFCNLKVGDVDFGQNQVVIRDGKYSRDRRVNIGAVCANILMRYIMEYHKQTQDFLFTTIQNGNKYSTSDLRKFIRVLAGKTNLGKRVYPHIFRNSLATNLLKRGANIILIQDQLGHSSILTTMGYIKILPCQIKTEYDYHIPAYV